MKNTFVKVCFLLFISIQSTRGQNNTTTSVEPSTTNATTISDTTTTQATTINTSTTEMTNATSTTEVNNATSTAEVTNATSTTEVTNATTTSTTELPTTTQEPKHEYTYTLMSNGSDCLIAQMKIMVTVTHANVTVPIDVSDTTKYKVTPAGKCAGNTSEEANLTLTIMPIANFANAANAAKPDSMTFTFEDKNSTITIATVVYTAQLDERFNQTGNESVTFRNYEFDYKLAKPENYFVCATPYNGNVGAAELQLRDIKIQAFNVKGNFSANGTECAADSVTTQNPITQTAGVITSTEQPMTTTITPLPSAPPAVRVGVKNGNITCIAGAIGLRFNIPYTRNSTNKTDTLRVDLPENAVVSGSCSSNTSQVLDFSFFSGWTCSLTFKSDFSSYSLDNMTLTYMYNSQFEDPMETGENTVRATGMGALKSNVGGHYVCNSKESLKKLDDVEVDTSNVNLQAFGEHSGNETYGTAQECADDSKTSDIVPIAVGAALAGLVVIVLIAYLIGRRKNHRGYQSV